MSYLLFIEKHGPYDHDLTLGDFQAAFPTQGECREEHACLQREEYDQLVIAKGAGQDILMPKDKRVNIWAVIVRFDGMDFVPVFEYNTQYIWNRPPEYKWRPVEGKER